VHKRPRSEPSAPALHGYATVLGGVATLHGTPHAPALQGSVRVHNPNPEHIPSVCVHESSNSKNWTDGGYTGWSQGEAYGS
jgi:hypothetical protein